MKKQVSQYTEQKPIAEVNYASAAHLPNEGIIHSLATVYCDSCSAFLSKNGIIACKLNSFIKNFGSIKIKIVMPDSLLFLGHNFLFSFWMSIKEFAISFIVAFKFLTIKMNRIFHTQI